MKLVQIFSKQSILLKYLHSAGSAAHRTTQHRVRRFNFKMSNQNAETEFQPKISLTTPLQDYKKLVEEKMQSEELVDDEILQRNFARISAQMRETVWKLLFVEQPTKTENLTKAGDCLREYKMDACFYSPWEYNEWIPKVRDELLKREMLQFWREQIVKSELGPCWAKDSDYFDRLDDEEPAEFYNYAGCVAPFSKQAKKPKLDADAKSSAAADAASTSLANPTVALSGAATVATGVATAATKAPEKIGLETPSTDYQLKLEEQQNVDADDEDAHSNIFAEVRQVIWTLLFGEEQLSQENYRKATDTLEAYKRDACFFNPWDYNDWIVQVRDELLERKLFDFWKDVIVERQLGLCWYKDSDFFDDTEDPAPLDFYKSLDEAMKVEKTKATV